MSARVRFLQTSVVPDLRSRIRGKLDRFQQCIIDKAKVHVDVTIREADSAFYININTHSPGWIYNTVLKISSHQDLPNLTRVLDAVSSAMIQMV